MRRKLYILCFLFLSCQSEAPLFERACKQAEGGAYQEAIDAFSELIHNDEKHQLAYYFRGICYQQQERYDRALHDFNKVISYHAVGDLTFILNENHRVEPREKEASVLKAFFHRGQVRYYLGDFENSIRDFQTCIDHNFQNAIDPHVWQGYVRLKQKNIKKACLAFHSARKAAYDDEVALKDIEALLSQFCN